MQKTVLAVFWLFSIMLLSSSFSVAISSDAIDSDFGDESSNDFWWEHWERDKNRNGIDDLIDEKIASNLNERVPIYLKYERELKQSDSEIVTEFDLELKYVFEFINTISARDVHLKDIMRLRQLPGVGMIELQLPIEPHLDVSNPAIKARNSTEYSPNTAWTLGYSGKGINIAIIDTGVDEYHESLMGKFVAGVSFEEDATSKDGTYNPNDVVGHGTYCAGIALGTGGTTDLDLDGEPDFMGVATDAKIIDVQYSINLGATSDQMTRSIQWVIDYKDTDWPDQPDEYDGIDVISISSDIDGTPGEAAAAAAESGIIVVTSAGNDGPNNPPPSVTAWPDKVIVVASVFDQETISRDDDTLAVSSSRGPRVDGALKPDISAPGQFITAPTRNSYKRYGLPTGIEASGTSFAAPHVAGVVAMMLEVAPNLTPDEVIWILHETAEARGDPYDPEQSDKYNEDFGWGIVDAYMATLMTQEYDDRPPIITDISVQVSGITATINWLTHKKANSIIDYGTSQSQLTESKSDLDNYTYNHSMTLTGLDEGTDYYFKIKGYDENNIGPGESPIGNFTTEILPDTTPPGIYNVEIIGKSDSTATIFWNTDELADSKVEYGLTAEYGSMVIDIKMVWVHSITLFGLESDTTYHFRINSSDASLNYNLSEDFNFTTDDTPDILDPVITELTVRDITDTTAIIEWKTNEPCNWIIKIGETDSYGKVYSDLDYYWKEFSIKLTGLKPSTRYYYRVESKDPSDNNASIGDETIYFYTEGPPDTTPPYIESGPQVTMITHSTASIVWTTDEKSDSLVEYGFDKDDYESEKRDDNYVLIHNITLTNLKSDTTYHFRVKSRDSSPNANEIVSVDDTFKTLIAPDITPPIMIGSPITIIGEYTATITWITDESSTSEVIYGTELNMGYSEKDDSKVKEHMITITGLTPSTTYYFRVKSTDEAGNVFESYNYSFETPEVVIPIDIRFNNLGKGDILTGVVTIMGEVTGGTGDIQSIEYRIDNETWKSLGKDRTFAIELDTSVYSEGEHTLYVRAMVGEVSMEEDITFFVEHQEKAGERETSSWLPYLIIALVAIIIIAVVPAISRMRRRPRPTSETLDLMEEIDGVEGPFSIGFTPTSDAQEIGFIPDEEPEISDGTEDEISFIPDTTALSEEPEVTFISGIEPVSFSVEEEIPHHLVYDTVRCPRCKRLFNADISSSIQCPDCGFSADLRR
ncbi:MAG: S8 family serine peptidase [Thermoplasmata archaeon]|nr:MAG: S8 family serine peptidase [Thermoplasmata archaeon]